TPADGLELFGVVGDAAARAAQREARTDHRREARAAGELGDPALDFPGLVHAVRDARLRRLQADAAHGLLELLAVFGLLDGFGVGADQLDTVLLEHAMLGQVERAVERGLPAHGGQQRVGALALDDLLDDLPGDRLDVGDVGSFRVGHDGGRVAVDQHHLVAFLLQRLAGLGPGVVELAGLTDDDRAGADD